MKINLFENKYKPSNAIKIFFVDIVCFLLVSIVSVSFCYSYFSDNVSVEGSTTMAKLSVQYQVNAGSGYAAVDDIYMVLNEEPNSNDAEIEKLSETIIQPGDTITIVGRAVNTSNVSVYFLARLEIVVKKNGSEQSTTKTIWYNIGSNDNGEGAETPAVVEAVELYTDNTTGLYQVGAGSLGSGKYKELQVSHTFAGTEYENGDVIESVTFTLQVHQKDHLSTASDLIELYKPHATGITQANPNGFINGYTTESVYATHYMTGNAL